MGGMETVFDMLVVRGVRFKNDARLDMCSFIFYFIFCAHSFIKLGCFAITMDIESLSLIHLFNYISVV